MISPPSPDTPQQEKHSRAAPKTNRGVVLVLSGSLPAPPHLPPPQLLPLGPLFSAGFALSLFPPAPSDRVAQPANIPSANDPSPPPPTKKNETDDNQHEPMNSNGEVKVNGNGNTFRTLAGCATAAAIYDRSFSWYRWAS